MNSVLFVCSANICRSPMAMGLLRGKLQDEADSWRIESAGVWALPEYPAATNTLYVLEERGVNLADHRSRQIDRQLIKQFNLILTMEVDQKEALRIAFPEYSGRIFLLTEMVKEKGDIADPIGGSVGEFQITARELEQILDQGMDQIRRLSGDHSG